MNYDTDSLANVIKSKTDIMLTPNFKLSQLIRTDRKEDNWPTSPSEILSLQRVCMLILEKVWANFGTVKVSSGYRSVLVNNAIGGSTKSQHMKAQAADFEVPGVDNSKVAFWIRDNLDFDQLILEFYTQGQANSGWVHCSVKRKNNRKDLRTARKENGQTHYLPGLIV